MAYMYITSVIGIVTYGTLCSSIVLPSPYFTKTNFVELYIGRFWWHIRML